jgi:hypothetical protein
MQEIPEAEVTGTEHRERIRDTVTETARDRERIMEELGETMAGPFGQLTRALEARLDYLKTRM